jgi:competence protein ComFC
MKSYIVEIMLDKLSIENINFDYILYVPLHKKRERKRGFNQSKIIANQLGKELGIEVLDILERSKNTRRLFELDEKERQQELKNVFKISKDIENYTNKNILLIDDIFTTGSTVNEISKLLKLNGINEVYIFTFLTKVNSY